MEGTTRMIARERVPVMTLLRADPDEIAELTCRRCGYVGEIRMDVRRIWSTGYTYPTCRDRAACEARADAKRQMAEPVIVRIQATHIECACCGGRLPNGRQHVEIQGGRILHFSHALCNPQCQSGRGLGVPA